MLHVVSSHKETPINTMWGHSMVPCIRMQCTTTVWRRSSCTMSTKGPSAPFPSTIPPMTARLSLGLSWPAPMTGPWSFGLPMIIKSRFEVSNTRMTTFTMWVGTQSTPASSSPPTMTVWWTYLIWPRTWSSRQRTSRSTPMHRTNVDGTEMDQQSPLETALVMSTCWCLTKNWGD